MAICIFTWVLFATPRRRQWQRRRRRKNHKCIFISIDLPMQQRHTNRISYIFLATKGKHQLQQQHTHNQRIMNIAFCCSAKFPFSCAAVMSIICILHWWNFAWQQHLRFKFTFSDRKNCCQTVPLRVLKCYWRTDARARAMACRIVQKLSHFGKIHVIKRNGIQLVALFIAPINYAISRQSNW